MDTPTYHSSLQFYTLFNLHNDEDTQRLMGILATKPGTRTPVIALCGSPQSGRRYFLEAAMWQARSRGARFRDSRLDLTGLDPTRPGHAKEFFANLIERHEGGEKARAESLIKFLAARIQPKLSDTIFGLGGITILVEAGIVLTDLAGLHSETFERIEAMQPSGRELLHEFLKPLTQDRRLILHIPESASLPGPLRTALLAEAAANSNLTLVLSAPKSAANWDIAKDSDCARFQLSSLDTREISLFLRQRFGRSTEVLAPSLYEYSGGLPGLLARALRRLIDADVLEEKSGEWQFKGLDHPDTLEIFASTLHELWTAPMEDLDQERTLFAKSFLTAAALCGRLFPVHPLLEFLGINESDDQDAAIDLIDALWSESLLDNTTLASPTFPRLLVYRFQDPLAPAVILKHSVQVEQVATKLANFLENYFLENYFTHLSREKYRLILRVAHYSNDETRLRMERTLAWLVNENDANSLHDYILQDLTRRRITPAALVHFANRVHHIWPPALRLALLNAIQPQNGDYSQLDLGQHERWRYHWLFGLTSKELAALEEAGFHLMASLDLAATDPQLAAACHALGTLRYSQGLYDEANAFLLRALTIHESARGPDHPNTATTLYALGTLRHSQGLYAEANAFLLRALAIEESAHGPDHPNIASTLHTLGTLRHSQGLYAEANAFLLRALAIRESAHGPDHPDTATTLYILGSLRDSQGLYQEADAFLLRALAIYESAHGPDHPDTATTLLALGTLRYSQGLYQEADAFLLRALTIRESAHGPDHPLTATTLYALGSLRHSQGLYAEANAFLLSALAIYESAHGPDHPDTATTLLALGTLRYSQGLYQEADAFLLRALAIYESAHGPDHPNIASTLHALGTLRECQSRYDVANEYLLRASSIYQFAHGSDHPGSASILRGLGILRHSQVKFDEADDFLGRALAIHTSSLGPNHPKTANTLQAMGALRLSQKLYEEAAAFLLPALAVYESAVGPDHADTATTRFRIAALRVKEGRPHESEAHGKMALSNIPRRHKRQLLLTISTSIELQGRPEEANYFRNLAHEAD